MIPILIYDVFLTRYFVQQSTSIMRSDFLPIHLHLRCEIVGLYIFSSNRRSIKMSPPWLILRLQIDKGYFNNSNDIISKHIVPIPDLKNNVFRLSWDRSSNSYKLVPLRITARFN